MNNAVGLTSVQINVQQTVFNRRRTDLDAAEKKAEPSRTGGDADVADDGAERLGVPAAAAFLSTSPLSNSLW